MVINKKIDTFVNKYDMFGSPVPAFNYEGMDKIGSIPGIFFTILTYCVLLLYAAKKFTVLFFDSDSLISETI